MRKLICILALFFCSFAFTQTAQASHAAGGELLYEHISGNTYRFRFKFYRDCSGINAPSWVRLCYLNSCNVSNPNSIFLTQVSGPVLVNGDCPNISTNCTTPNGLPSYQEYIYEGNVTLSEPCNAWRFWVNINARNPMNFLNSNFNNVNLYVETSFNNTISVQDNSPVFNRLPVPYCCINTPFTYDNSASDLDGDSLVYESIMPRTHPTFQSCPSTPPVNCTYPVFANALNPTDNPLPCNNTFTINPATGLFSMTPNQIGKGAIAIKVSQYRNGQLLGYIVRDIQTIVLSCNISSPSLYVDTSSLANCTLNNDTITACAGNTFNFCFSTQTSDPSSVLFIQSSLANFTPPVSLVHSSIGTDSMYSCFNWSPSLADTGWYYLNLLIIDSICRPIGVLNTDTLTKIFPIYIAPRSLSILDTTICEPNSYAGYTQSGTYVDTLISQYGCDSIRTLNLTVNTRSYTTENVAICAPNSYMGYTASGTYIDTFQNQMGCDSIHTLHLVVHSVVTTSLTQSICAPSSYLGYSQSGTYVDTFQTAAGCDSIRILQLTVTPLIYDTIVQTICEPVSFQTYTQSGVYIDTFIASTGCDSIQILNLIVHNRSYQTIGVSICAPSSYLGYSQSGTYVDTFTNAAGCDSIHTLNLSVAPIVYQTVSQTICAFDSYQGYTHSGTYTDTFAIGQGCDSIRTLHLTVLPLQHDSIYQTICEPLSYQGYTQSGLYVDTFTNSLGCDSMRSLFLTVNPRTYHTTQATICQYDQFLGYTQTGTYIDTFTNTMGCDSIHTLALYVNPISNTIVNHTICELDTFQGYWLSGVYVDTFMNAAGCDSIQVLNLTVTPTLHTTINKSICYPDSFFGYSQSGTYIDTFTSAQACDSIRTINLVVNQIQYTSIYQTICEPQSYQGYGSSGTYVDTFVSATDCDSIQTLYLTVHPKTYSTTTMTVCEPASFWGYSQSGIYTDTLMNANGCDSLRTLNLTVHPISYINLNQAICETDTFLGYWQSGTYVDTFTNSNGCDSIRTIYLVVNPNTFETIDTAICAPSTIFGYSQSGTYIDTLSTAAGCMHERTLNLIVNVPYFLDTSYAVCEGEPVYIGGQSITSSGVYYDSLLTSAGCDSVIKVTLTVHPLPAPDLGPDLDLCEGDTAILHPGIFNKYTWWNGDSANCAKVNTSGDYWVQVFNQYNCSQDDKVRVNVVPYPEISIQSDTGLCIGRSIDLHALGATQFVWHGLVPNMGEVSYSNTYMVQSQFSHYKFKVIGWDHIGCKDTTVVDVFPQECCGKIVIPNAFSPNGDGANDTYGVIRNPEVESFTLQIFNRWGQCIFKTESFEDRWDGTYQGEYCLIGSYYYIVHAKCYTESKPRFYKGDVTLIR